MTAVETDNGQGFADLGLPPSLLSTVEKLGFTDPTPVQKQAIPLMLNGKDVLAQAQTGTGKTAAFSLPALAGIDANVRKPQLLVLAPTRELALQGAEAIESFAADIRGLKIATLYGGSSYGPQFRELERGAQVVVGTPGRLMDHLRRGSLDLSEIRCCVLDEADEMLNMGFLEDIEWILERVNDEAQMAFFSATMPSAIRRIADRFLTDPQQVRIATTTETRANIEQLSWLVSGVTKMTALARMVEMMDYDAMLVFVRTRNDTQQLSDFLEQLGFKAAALHGDLNQAQRERIVTQLHNGERSIVVATDVVARGLDVPRINVVVNYDLPNDSEAYVHRIGRTGRAGREGLAVSYVRPRERYLLKRYERATNSSIGQYHLPKSEELAKHRLDQRCEQVKEQLEKTDITRAQEWVSHLLEHSGASAEQLAALLLLEAQGARKLDVEADPKPRDRRERNDRNDRNSRNDRGDRRGRNDRRDRRDRNDRNDRGDRGERRSRTQVADNTDYELFRLEVGREHGARPGDIVGAIANEAGLEGRYIHGVRIYDNHTLVRLPAGMPKEVYQQLKRTRVRNQPLELSKATEAARQEHRNDNGRGGRRQHRDA